MFTGGGSFASAFDAVYENMDLSDLYDFPQTTIGHDVWIGKNVTIINGVHIGNGAVIGANAVVTKDIPDYAIAVGVPAKVIKCRFTPPQIAALNTIKWWDWPDETIAARFYEFRNIDDFITKYSGGSYGRIRNHV